MITDGIPFVCSCACADDEDGEGEDDDEMEEGEDDEGEEESEDAPLNAAELIARQKANKKLLKPMTKEMFAGEDEEKVRAWSCVCVHLHFFVKDCDKADVSFLILQAFF